MSNTAGEMGQGEGTLSAAAECVSRCRGDFNRMSSALTDQLMAMQGQWAGRGGSAFFALHQAWTEQQAKIVGALDRFDESLRTTERDNVSTDEEMGSGFSQMAGRLGGGAGTGI